MRKRCYLCGGKLANNICTECGLDNSKTDKDYVMGRSGCEESLTHVHSGYEEPTAGKTMTREAKQQLKDEIRRRTQKEKIQRRTQKEKSGSRGKMAILLIVIILMIGVFGTFGTYIYDEIRYTYEAWESDDMDSYEETDYDPYSWVTRELSENGEYYEISLEAGVYKGGVHIPEGEYVIEANSGEGSITLDDEENGIYVNYYFGEESEYAVESVEGFRVYRGAIIEIENQVSLHFQTENAQMDLTQIPNPNTESKTLSEKFTVGKDIPAGVYDVKCVEGSGIFDYNIDRSEDYSSYEGKLIGANSSSFAETYRNIVLPEGTEVEISGMTVTLTPSEYIESEDYDSFYPKY